MNESITTKARKAMRRYLELRGFEVLEDGWAHGKDAADFIAIDGENGDLVFVSTEARANGNGEFPGFEPDREAFERLAAAYLTDADVTDRAVRLDVLSMLVLSESRGLIRHHVNVLSAWSGDVGL